MKNKIFIYLLFLGLFTFACKEKEETVYEPYPLNLTVDHFLNLNHLRWNKISASDFVSYSIWRSIGNDSIPNDPATSSTAIVVPSALLNQNSLEFVHNVTASGSLPTFYRIQMKLKNRSIWSRNVKIENKPITTLDNPFEIILQDTVGHKAFMINHGLKKIQVYDTKQNKIILSKSMYLYPSIYATAKLGILDDKKELYISSNDSLLVLDAETLSRKAQYKFESTILAIDTDNNGKVFISQRYGDFKIIDRRKNQEIFTSKIGTSANEYRCFYIPNQNKLLKIQGVTPFKASVITLNSNNDAFLSESTPKELSNIAGSSISFVITNWHNVQIYDDNHFFLESYLFTFDMAFVSKLPLSFVDRLYLDKKTASIYASSNTSIARYSFPNNQIKQVFISGKVIEHILYAKNISEVTILLSNSLLLTNEIDRLKL